MFVACYADVLDIFRFLNRVARHPQLNCDTDFIDFVEVDGELPKSSSTSSLSGAGLVRLFNRVGDSIGKYTYAMPENDDVRHQCLVTKFLQEAKKPSD